MSDVTVHLTGGLGNQMFQYALGRRLSIERNCELYLDTSFYNTYKSFGYGLNNYNINAKKINNKRIFNNKYIRFTIKKINALGYNSFKKKYYEKKLFMYDDNVLNEKYDTYYGTWQSFKYFENIRTVLLNDFTIKANLSDGMGIYLREITSSESVSLHIRRGDYFKNERLQKKHGLLTLDYYYNAIRNFPNNSVYFIFSDDINWVKNNFNINKELVFIELKKNSPEIEINLMSMCKCNIISNSTFSWWAAWLNENERKIIIAPQRWYANKKTSLDLVPDKWIQI